MTVTAQWTVKRRDHPGSSEKDIADEPDWGSGHQHRIGFRNRHNRVPGLSGDGDHHAWIEEARKAREALKDEVAEGDLVDIRTVMEHQQDLHLQHPENKSRGWRYVIETTEDWIRNQQDWPININKRKKEEEEKEKEDKGDKKRAQQEHEWRRAGGADKHHDAYATEEHHGDSTDDQEDKSEQDDLENDMQEKYSAQELALLRALEQESKHIAKLKMNDGKGKSPQIHNMPQISIDEQDQFSPDNWIPRSSKLIRVTGKHPLNAEPNLDELFGAGLITPTELHYVRNHGAVPRLLWEFHTLSVEYNGKAKTFPMDDIASMDTINIPIALACDGNRRKELNQIKRSKGFNWGSGAISCSYWKGPLLRDILLSVGVPDTSVKPPNKRYWVNFEGADDLSNGAYATCLPLEHAMAPENDVILAYQMNDLALPPDHGYPLRLMIPGYVGGRCVKWLKKIWISDKENDSHYHIWDNRVLPSFVTEMDGPFADALFRHPDTACNEQNLNSIIVKPAHNEVLPLTEVRKGKSYRIAGIAYDGGGHEVQRVEVSLDDGKTWLYCIRKFPEAPIRHGHKYWAWIHWYVDVDIFHLLESTSITVRCFNVFKNTQPETPSWNIMGMMNNCWYVVRSQKAYSKESDVPQIQFLHPTEPGIGEGGWMKPSTEERIAEAKQAAGAPEKQFTRAEIEKHTTQDDCWIVVDGKVYDATSVLSWHPGGAGAILSHAGKVHQGTTDEFSSIHDDFAYQKLKECSLGVVTEKAASSIKKNAEAAEKERWQAAEGNDNVTLQKHRWTPVKLVNRQKISDDSRTYTFKLPDDKPELGLGTCQHILVGFHMRDSMLVRSYTPTRPLLPAAKDSKDDVGGENQRFQDGNSTFDLTVKTYFPDENQPGGTMSNILDCIPIGEDVEIRGPTGDIVYNGSGTFDIEGNGRTFKRISLVLGGSGVTPGYSLIARIVMTPNDMTEVRVVDANKTENDILMREELETLQQKSNGRVKVTHVLSHAGDDWEGLTGHVDQQKLEDNLFPPRTDTVALLCGPPAMIQKAVLPALKDWGYVEDENLFGF